jgi:transcriptional repressor NrdR
VPISVIKRNGDRESFDRTKVLRGIIRACEKTGVSNTQLEALVDEIEAELQQRSVREVESNEIGELVLKRLQKLSEVAYVRFASVYQQFQGIRDFADALNHLQSTQENGVRRQLFRPSSALLEDGNHESPSSAATR